MSGLFDWYVLGILSRTWREQIAPNPARFASLFQGPEGEILVPTSVLEGWHAELTRGASQGERNGFVRFSTAYSPNAPQLPQVAVSMSDEPDERQSLGHAGPPDSDGNRTFTMLLRETVAIDIWTPNPDLTRALHIVIRGMLMSNSDDFARLCYHGPYYMGGDDLMPEDGLMPGATQQPEVFLRRQRWYAISQPVWRGGALRSKMPHVYAADVTVDGVDGGVSVDLSNVRGGTTPQPPGPASTQPTPPPARTAVLDGTSSYITHDELATGSLAYNQTGSWHWIWIFKSVDDSEQKNLEFTTPIDVDIDPRWSLLTRAIGGNAGQLRFVVRSETTTLRDIDFSPSTQVVDDTWHVVQCADQYDGASDGIVYVQVDGGARETTSYARFPLQAGFPNWSTHGALRAGPIPTVTIHSAQRLAYRALITGEKFSQAQMTAFWSAFNTGGGRVDLHRVTESIQAAMTTGTIQWAGPIDDVSSAHVNNAGSDPVLVSCTFEAANF